MKTRLGTNSWLGHNKTQENMIMLNSWLGSRLGQILDLDHNKTQEKKIGTKSW